MASLFIFLEAKQAHIYVDLCSRMMRKDLLNAMISGVSKESPDMEEPLGENDFDHSNQSSSSIYSTICS